MRVPKKILALTVIAGVAVGGLLPVVYHSNVNTLLICALIMGIGLGFIATVNPMLLSMYFEGDERSSLMGVGTAMNSVGSMIMMFLGGILGANVWHNTYYVFLITILIFFLVMLGLPLDKVAKKEHHSGGHTASSVKTAMKEMNKYVFLVSMLAFAISFLYVIFPTNLSIIIADKNLGGTAITGVVNALGTVGGLIAGFTINRINRVLKDKSLASGFIFMAVSFILVHYASNVAMVIVGSAFSGLAMAMIYSTIPFYVSIIAKPVQIALAMSVFQFLNSLGGIISPIVLSSLGVGSGAPAFIFGAICCLVIGITLLLTSFGKRALSNRYIHECLADEIPSVSA
ncbi:Bacillibactin exporter [compost metagenome]